MTFTQETQKDLAIANADIAMTQFRLNQCLRNPDLHHTLPGILCDYSDSLARMVDVAGAAEPAIIQAMASGARSIHELHSGAPA